MTKREIANLRACRTRARRILEASEAKLAELRPIASEYLKGMYLDDIHFCTAQIAHINDILRNEGVE